MPLTKQESIGLGVGVLNIWDKYVDDNVIAYIRKEESDIGIRVVKIEDFKCLRKDIIKIV